MLAFESHVPTVNPRLFTLPEPKTPYPKSSPHEDYFWTWADLENVVEMSPCRSKSGSDWNVVGLLLRYSNGHQACVGQLRQDRLERPIIVGSSQGMWPGFLCNDPHISSIDLSHPSQSG